MSLALIQTRALDGLQAPHVVVEVHLDSRLPSFGLVDLKSTEQISTAHLAEAIQFRQLTHKP